VEPIAMTTKKGLSSYLFLTHEGGKHYCALGTLRGIDAFVFALLIIQQKPPKIKRKNWRTTFNKIPEWNKISKNNLN
jgi:hypothetical protein